MPILEEVVKQYVRLGSPSAQGWYPCVHKGCDHGKKGPRAAFLFENNSVAFHCFNCGIKTVSDPDSVDEKTPLIPKKLEKVLLDFGIPEEEINKIRLESLKDKQKPNTSSTKKERSINPLEIPLPDHFYKLSDADESDKWALIARYYLEERNIDPDSYPFYLSTGIPQKIPHSHVKELMVKKAQQWKGRVIFPIYKDGKVIFYQGRDLTEKKTKKYLSADVSRDTVIFGFDRLFSEDSGPLYIVEGFFDAYHINGVALLGNEMSKAQIAWLNKSHKDKVYVPDRYGNGAQNAEKALKQGWKVSIPDTGDCKDINASIIKYGRLYVLNALREGTLEGFGAELALEKLKQNDKRRSYNKNKATSSQERT